jgi:hypothetical protein
MNKLSLIATGLFLTVGTAFSGIKEDATTYGDRLALAQLNSLQENRLSTDAKDLGDRVMMAIVAEARMEGYNSSADISAFASIAIARMTYWLKQLPSLPDPDEGCSD